MSVEIARGVGPARIDIAHERFGEPDPRPSCSDGPRDADARLARRVCEALAGQDSHVIRLDNRDIGLSSHMTDAPAPDIAPRCRGDTSSASYTLSDMAGDTVGLLDALGWTARTWSARRWAG